jgi:hypothetical protein
MPDIRTFDCKIRGSHSDISVDSSRLRRCSVVGRAGSHVSKCAFEILELITQRHSVEFLNTGISLFIFMKCCCVRVRGMKAKNYSFQV